MLYSAVEGKSSDGSTICEEQEKETQGIDIVLACEIEPWRLSRHR